MLFGRASRLAKMTKELAAAKKANARLELEVKRLKEVVAGDKKTFAATRKRLKAAVEGLKTTKLERGSLSSTLTRRERYFMKKGADISSFLITSLG